MENTGLVAGVVATKYTTVVALAFLLYDSALTFDSEVKYVWTQKWSFGTILYLYNRYLGIIILIFNTSVSFNRSLTPEISCRAFVWWETLSTICAAACAEGELETKLDRTLYAVYNRNKKLLFTLLAIFMAELTAVMVAVGLATSRTVSFTATPEGISVANVKGPFQDFTGCYGVISQLDFITWLPPLAFEAILCFLMLYKAWTLYRRDWNDPLLSIIVRDSVLYFMAMFAVLLGNCLFWALSGVVPSSLPDVAVSWSVAVPCGLGSRLLLNIRERYFFNKVITGASVQLGQDIEMFHAASKRHVSSVGNVSQSSPT
ncbi:hypothetical protein K439DRAFT_1638490 [Ramaria rubella]|nr:hypothetical protein K439DRAFT_1638490 [Ramaria rubella]